MGKTTSHGIVTRFLNRGWEKVRIYLTSFKLYANACSIRSFEWLIFFQNFWEVLLWPRKGLRLLSDKFRPNPTKKKKKDECEGITPGTFRLGVALKVCTQILALQFILSETVNIHSTYTQKYGIRCVKPRGRVSSFCHSSFSPISSPCGGP